MSNSGKFARSVRLFKLSLRIIAKNKRLLFFPLANFVFLPLILVAFLASMNVPHVSSGPGHGTAVGNGYASVFDHLFLTLGHLLSPDGWTGYVSLIAIYLIGMFCITFFNVALYQEIMQAMAGERVSLRHGLAFASGRIRTVLAWSLFAGLAGVLIRLLAERLGFVGRLVFGLTGFAWSVAATFVIPVIINDESANPVSLLRTSAATIRKTWGESLIGYMGIQLARIVIVPVWISIVTISVMLFILLPGIKSLGVVLVPSACLLGILVLAALLLVESMANSISRCALYVYASEGVVPELYSPEMMDAAWTVKRG